MKAMQPMTFGDFELAPFRVRLSGRVSAPPDVVWAEFEEPARWVDWFPMMHHAAWTSSSTRRAGAEREVALTVFGRFRERILAFDPGARFAFTMIESESPLVRRMAEDWTLERDGSHTRLGWTVVATPTTLGRAGQPALRLVLRRMFGQAVSNLERVLRQRGTHVS